MDSEPAAEPEPYAEPAAEPEPYAEPAAEPEPYAEPAAEPEPKPQASVDPFPSLASESEETLAAEVSKEAVVISSNPRNAAECRQAGGECRPTAECPNAEFGWNQPFKGICGRSDYECCFEGW